MKIGAIAQKIGSILKKGEVTKKAADVAKHSVKAATETVSKIPEYAAVKINGLVVYMPVSQVAKHKGAEILSKAPLHSAGDVLKEIGKHCNKL